MKSKKSNWTSGSHLLLQVLLIIVRLLTNVQSIGRCDVSSVLVPDANVMGGIQSTAGSNVTECEFICAQMTSCLGFDWNRGENKCFLLTSGVESINYNFSGVDHYNLLRDTNNCFGSCSYPRWVPIVNSHCFGGRALDTALGLNDCAGHCLENTNCSSFDWDPRNSGGRRCWIISDSCSLPSPAPGVFHYGKNCSPISTTVSRTSASSVTTLPVTAVQTFLPTALPSTYLPKQSTVPSLPTTHPSSFSTTTTTTSTTTLPFGVSVVFSTYSTKTSTTTTSDTTTTTTQSASSMTRASVSVTSGIKSTVASGATRVTSSSSTRNGDATISAASVTSGAVRNTTPTPTTPTLTTPTLTTPTLTTPTLTMPTLNTPTLNTPTLNTPTPNTPKENANPTKVAIQGQQMYDYVDYQMAIKPAYIVLAGLGGGCLLLVLTAVVILCQYPLGSEEDGVPDRRYKPYEVNSTASSNDIVDMDVFDIEHGQEFRASGVIAPEFEATSLN